MRTITAILVAIVALFVGFKIVLPLVGAALNLLSGLVTLAVVAGILYVVYAIVARKPLGRGGRSLP